MSYKQIQVDFDNYSLIKEYKVEMEHCSLVYVYEHDYESNNFVVQFRDYAEIDAHEENYFGALEEVEDYFKQLIELNDMLDYELIVDYRKK